MASGSNATMANRYSRVAIWLHWLIALAIVTNIALAELTEDLPRAERFAWMGWHISIGMTVLVLTLARISWRLMHPVAALPASMPRWQVLASKASHILLYGLMLALPLSGWIWFSVGDEPKQLSWFGLFDWPLFPITGSEALHDTMHGAHEVFGKMMFVLAIVHIAAAFKHWMFDNDGVMGRMNPFA